LLVKSDPLTSWYVYLECYNFSLYPQGLICTSYRETIKYLAPFIPSFSYNYLCGSTLLAAYIPVYLYLYSLQLLLPFLNTLLLSRWLIYPSLPPILRKKLPGVLWPHHWLAKDPLSQQSNRPGSGMHSLPITATQQRPTPRLLLRMDTIMTGHMQDLLILLTFGLCCPALAIVIGTSICFSILNVRLIIGRFILLRNPALQEQIETNSFPSPLSPSLSLTLRPTSLPLPSSSTLSLPSHRSLRVYQSDLSLVALTAALSDLGRSYHQVLWVIVWNSCLFWTFLSWDIGGDEVGWNHCLWLPLLSVGFIVLIRLGIVAERISRNLRSLGEDAAGDDVISEIHERSSLDDDSRPTLELNPLSSRTHQEGNMNV
jgi:hypothetical protein